MVSFFLISLLFLHVLFFILCMLASRVSLSTPTNLFLVLVSFPTSGFLNDYWDSHSATTSGCFTHTWKGPMYWSSLFLFVLIVHMQCIAIACSCFTLQAHLWKASLTLLLSVSPGLRARLRLIPNPSERYFPKSETSPLTSIDNWKPRYSSRHWIRPQNHCIPWSITIESNWKQRQQDWFHPHPQL